MKIFISARVTPEKMELISNRFEEVDFHDWAKYGMLPSNEFAKRMQDCDILYTETDTITNDMLTGSPNLFAIIDSRGTVTNIDIQEATRNGIVIINAPGRNAEGVADLTVALIIIVARNLFPANQDLKADLWKKGGMRSMYLKYQGWDMKNKTVGLVGLGHIGRIVAKRLKGFDVKLIGYDPFISAGMAEKMGVELVEWERIFQDSDFLSLHIPLNEETKGMIGEKEFSLMKPEAYFINTARAAVVDEDALIKALTEKKIAGAGLDVFHTEPLSADYPLLQLPQVVCIPHLGGASKDVISHQSRISIDGLFGFLDGSPCNVVNPDALETAQEKLKQKMLENSQG